MIPKGVQRLSDQILRKSKRMMIFVRFFERVTSQTREA